LNDDTNLGKGDRAYFFDYYCESIHLACSTCV